MRGRFERRTFLKAGIGFGVGLRLADPSIAAQEDPASIRPTEGDLLVRLGDSSATPLGPDDIPLSARPTMAWAMDPADKTVRSGSRLNQLLLVRLDPVTLTPETLSRAAEGVVAYTAICTHEGCDIDDWLADKQHLSCACHFSTFDPKDSGRVVEGPALRMLPALPLKVVDAKLVVAKPFTSRVGFGEPPL
ncbi:MAG: Rieske 2Fe-2S domain-containing protein [Acidobacteria bacterium]|nr:Rieske 2Fe-2S domain-containing protein [Acidobacteriota bacterium]